jgi:hypothetical protein
LGDGFTVTVIKVVIVHPMRVVPVTPYEVVVVGLTVIVEDVAPVSQRKLTPPLIESVADAPAQITEGVATPLKLGTVKRLGFVVMDPQALEIMHRYLEPFSPAVAITFNVDVKAPL